MSARCPKGERLVFGGFRADVTYDQGFILLKALLRTGPRRWTVEANNAGAFQTGDLEAFAYCASKR